MGLDSKGAGLDCGQKLPVPRLDDGECAWIAEGIAVWSERFGARHMARVSPRQEVGH